MKINSISTSSVSANTNNKNRNDAAFGYGVYIDRKGFKNTRAILKNPVKIKQLNELEQFLGDKLQMLNTELNAITEPIKNIRLGLASIKLHFKIAKGGVPQIAVKLQGETGGAITISHWFNANGKLIRDDGALKGAVKAQGQELLSWFSIDPPAKS